MYKLNICHKGNLSEIKLDEQLLGCKGYLV